MNKFWILPVAMCLLFGGCHRQTGKFSPELDYSVQDKYLLKLPTPFPTLTEAERHQDWGKEYTVGVGFSHQLDLYQAMTAFKRAEILAPQEETQRVLEMRYDIVLCYYLGHRYADVVYAFEQGSLHTVTPEFPAFHDLLVILYDSYQKLDEPEKAENILALIRTHYPGTAQKLELSHAITKAKFSQLGQFAASEPTNPAINVFLDNYQSQKKKPRTAQLLNAALPGAGYFYLGQPQSGMTAIFLNGLFLAATYACFHNDQYAAGAILLSFECGWYFGGIVGAGLEAKHYNERLYERLASPLMQTERLFPVLMLRYGF